MTPNENRTALEALSSRTDPAINSVVMSALDVAPALARTCQCWELYSLLTSNRMEAFYL